MNQSRLAWSACVVLLALILAGCGPRSARAWAGTQALHAQGAGGFLVLPYHADALARAHEQLVEEHLVGGPFSPGRVDASREAFLQALEPARWLTQEEIQHLVLPQWRGRWQAALEGRDLAVAMEAGALVRQRQQAWVERFGARASGPVALPVAADAAAWQQRLEAMVPQQEGKPVDVLDADAVVQALVGAQAQGWDPHTHHVPPAVAQRYEEGALRVSTGLGVAWMARDGQMVVQSLVAGSPAQRSGALRAGDTLLAFRLGGDPWVAAIDLPQALVALDQAQGDLGLRVHRNGQAREVVVSMPQADQGRAFPNDEERLVVHRETWGEGSGALDVLRLEARFLYESGQDGQGVAAHAAQALAAAGHAPDLVVVDLRRCRGGAMAQAAQLAGLFVAGGDLLALRGRGGRVVMLPDPDPKAAWQGPVQAWVGPQTASAAEVVAQALADRAHAAVVGWPTFGKGTLQRRVELDLRAARNGEPSRLGELWVTTAELVGLSGHSLQKQGVALDYRLPGAVAEPWGERALEGALAPTAGGQPSEARALGVDVVGALQPGTPDTQGLAGWQAAGMAAHAGAARTPASGP